MPAPSDAAQTDDAGAALDLAPVAEHALGAAAEQLGRRAATSPTASSVTSGASEVRAGGEDDADVAGGAAEALAAPRPPPPARRRAGPARWRGRSRSGRACCETTPRARPSGRRDLRSDGRRQDGASRSRSRSGCARRGEDPVAVSADALQLYRGLEVLTGARRPPRSARGSSTGWSASSR